MAFDGSSVAYLFRDEAAQSASSPRVTPRAKSLRTPMVSVADSAQSRPPSFGPTNWLANRRRRSIATSSSIMNGDCCDVSRRASLILA
jgi:hypothetical protein